MKKHTELEVKYKMENGDMFSFKRFVESEFAVERFEYVTGPDYYFVKPESGEAIRYRVPSYQKEKGELTIKQKKTAENNINRIEVNIPLKNPSIEDVTKFVGLLGYELNFAIIKDCVVFELSDCVMAYYSVAEIGGSKPPLHFIEVEIKEEVVDSLSEDEAWGVLRYYESKLSAIGISPQRRVKKSLYEIFKKG